MMEKLTLRPLPGMAPLSVQERANVQRAADSLGAASSAVGKAMAAIGTALMDSLRVAGDMATRATYGDLATGPVSLWQLQNRLAAMRERLAIVGLAAAFEPDFERREALLSETITELFKIGRGEKAVIGQAHYWPAGLSFEEVHHRLWEMQSILAVGPVLAVLGDSPMERVKVLGATIEALTRVAQGELGTESPLKPSA